MIFATSIAPHDIERQQRAINSWERYNLPIISVNHNSEIEMLQPLFPKVQFLPAPKTTFPYYMNKGKHYVYVYDIINEAFKHDPDKSVFLLNSDIILEGIQFNPSRMQRNLHINNELDWFEYLSENSLIGFRRYDIDKTGTFTKSEHGYDGFVINKNFLHIIRDDIFVLGQAFWDWWLPMLFFVNNHATWTFDAPFLIHEVHPRNHTEDQWRNYFLIFKTTFPEIIRDDLQSKMYEATINSNSRTCNNFDIVL